MLGFWNRFQRWRLARAVRHYENTPERQAAENRKFDNRTQAVRPQGSGRRTAYDEGHTDDRFS